MEYSFYQLACENFIKIPNLQRAYAQGRDTERAIEIRNNFITDIKKVLDNRIEKANKNTHLSLDTVYGELKKDDKIFIPLDGQQRLTTLFLLHLYLACYTDNSLNGFLIDESGKSKFCYATRTTSEDFCNYLVHKDLCVNDRNAEDENFEKKEETEGEIQKFIKSDMDFQWTWYNDPTISSMLNMLDTIHKIFLPSRNKFEDYYEVLTCENDPAVTFYYQQIEDAIPADELYIRMNARGLALTEFENFKASLFYYLCDNQNNSSELMDYVKEIKNKIDSEWQDAMWKFCIQVGGNKRHTTAQMVDRSLLRLMHICILFQIMQKYVDAPDEQKKNADDFISLIKLFTSTKQFNYYQLTQCAYFSGSSMEERLGLAKEICRMLNLTCERINSSALEDSYDKLLKGFLSDEKCSYERILLFYVCYYMFPKTDENGDNRSAYRVLKRLIKYSYITEFVYFSRSLKALFSLRSNADHFLKNFQECTDPEKFLHKGFFANQMWEEYIKLLLKTKNSAWRSPIEEAEKDVFFDGQIFFLFECLLKQNISEATRDTKISAFRTEIIERADQQQLIEQFKKYHHLFSGIMKPEEEEQRNLLRKCMILRALETKGEQTLPDYPFSPEYAREWNENISYELRNPGSMIIESPNDDKLNWKRVLRLSMSNQNDDKPQYRSLIKWALQEALLKEECLSPREKLQAVVNQFQEHNLVFENTAVGKVCQTLADWCKCDWNGYFNHGIRLIENGKIALLGGDGARLYKNFQELHMMMVKAFIPNVEEDNYFGCLTIRCNPPEERIMLEYHDGKVRGCRSSEEYGIHPIWKECCFDISNINNLIAELQQTSPESFETEDTAEK